MVLRTPGHQKGAARGLTDRPDQCGVPPDREPQHADARRRAAAVREARGRGPQLRPRAVRVDARRRGDRPAVPQAPAPLAHDRRAAGLGRGRAVRHRPPHPAQRAAQARPDPRAPRPQQPPAQHPAGVGAAALGGLRHRGPPRRPGGALHEGPPLRWSTASPRCGWCRARSARTSSCATCRRPGTPAPGATGRTHTAPDGGLAEVSTQAMRTALGITAEAARMPSALIRTLIEERPQRDLLGLALRAPHDLQPEDHRLAPLRRPGLGDRAAAGDRQRHRHDDQRRRARDVRRRGTSLPPRARRAAGGATGRDGAGRAQGQGVPPRLDRGRQRGRLGDVSPRHRPRGPRSTDCSRSPPR